MGELYLNIKKNDIDENVPVKQTIDDIKTGINFMYPNYYIDSLVSDSNNPVYFQRYCRKKNQGNTGQNKYFLVAEYQLNPNQSTSATIDISELFACCSYYVPRASFTGPSWCFY